MPFSLEEMVAKYRHRGGAAALGHPPIAYAEGSCVGGSTEINSGLWHRLPDYLAEDWRRTYAIDEFTGPTLERYAEEMEATIGVSSLPGAPPRVVGRPRATAPPSSGGESIEFPRVFRYDPDGSGVKQTMTRTMLPRADGGRRRRPAATAGSSASRSPAAGSRVPEPSLHP